MDAGVVASEQAHGLGQHARRDSWKSPDLDGDRVVSAAGRIDALAQRRDACPGITQEHLTERGEEELPAATVEQGPPEDILELLDRLGCRRLADVERLGGVDDALAGGDFKEAGDVPELDAGIDDTVRQRDLRLSTRQKFVQNARERHSYDNPRVINGPSLIILLGATPRL
jgi:hypothetical protein